MFGVAMTGIFDGDPKPHDGSDGTKMPYGHSQDRARLERVPPECHEVAIMTGAVMFAPCVSGA